MMLQKEIVSKLAVFLGNKEVLGLTVEDEVTTIKVKDLGDSFFYNNFENKYVYNGADDEKRISNIKMNNENGFFVDTGIHVHGFKTISDIKGEGREVEASILANYDALKRLNAKQGV